MRLGIKSDEKNDFCGRDFMIHFRAFQAAIAVGLLTANISVAHADSSSEREAEEYMQTWEERGREACKDNERGCAAAGHALDRAAAAYEKAGKLDKAIAIRKMILDPQWHLDYTDYGRTAAFTLARNYQSIAEYENAAQIIETAVRRFAKSDEAPAALKEAIALRIALGTLEQAKDDSDLFAKNYGSKNAKDVPEIVVTVASGFERQGRLKEARTLLEKWISTIEQHGNIRDKIVAHALLGRIHVQEGTATKANAEFEIVRAAWARPEDALKGIVSISPTEAEQSRNLGMTLTAVGEALFFFAEQKRAEVEAIRFPDYAGPGDKDSVVRFVSTKISEWLRKKNQSIEEADRAYQKILAIEPMPPPRWVIASAGRVGFLWSSFVGEFRRAPTPKEWNSNTPLAGSTMTGAEIKKLYLEQLSSLTEPLTERSRQAFRVCVDYSRKFQWFDDHSRACWAWLEKNDRKRSIPVDELLPQPMHSALPIRSALVQTQ